MALTQQAKPHRILRESSPMVDTWWRDRFVSETGIHTEIQWEFREGFLKQIFRESSEIACNDMILRDIGDKTVVAFSGTNRDFYQKSRKVHREIIGEFKLHLKLLQARFCLQRAWILRAQFQAYLKTLPIQQGESQFRWVSPDFSLFPPFFFEYNFLFDKKIAKNDDILLC